LLFHFETETQEKEMKSHLKDKKTRRKDEKTRNFFLSSDNRQRTISFALLLNDFIISRLLLIYFDVFWEEVV
jgi:hypothetical protein